MPGRLEGKKAFVTAAGQGIGRAVVEAFVAEGAGALQRNSKRLLRIFKPLQLSKHMCAAKFVSVHLKLAPGKHQRSDSYPSSRDFLIG